MSPEMNDLQKLIEDHVSKIAEHCDSVRIFVTRQGDGMASNTEAISEGRGNVYSQFGQIREWMLMREEESREHARQVYNDDDEPEEGDSSASSE